MLETTSLNQDALSPTFAHAFYRQTIADFQQLGLESGNIKHQITEIFFDQSNIQTSLLNQYDLDFKDQSLLMRAFTHSSYVHESKVSIKSYERLEFYGDSVLGAFVTKRLFLNFEKMNEGELSKFRSALVNEESLSKLCDFLGLVDFLVVGKGELGLQANTSIRCDLFESLLGAIAIDQGVDRADSFLEEVLEKFEAETNEKFFDANKLIDFDPKTKLQEETLARFKCLPEYRSEKRGESFLIELFVKDQKIAEVISSSKKIGTKEIAKECLQNNLLEKIK